MRTLICTAFFVAMALSTIVSSYAQDAGAQRKVAVNGVEYGFRFCPAGTFDMGSPADEARRERDEVQHQVTFTQGFWMQETEVTQAMWNAVMDANPSRFQGDDNPVENVSWNDFQTFVEKLNALKVAPEGYEFALPTEAQWEYACRAGTTDALYGALDEIAWHETNSGDKTHPVATKAANAWGIFDMIGNVSEWVADAKGAYPTEAVTDPVNPGSERSDRVTRGGSYDDDAEDCRAAARSDEEPGDRDEEVGGRLALVPTAPPQAGAQRKVAVNGVEYGFRFCPAGTFDMGSPADEARRERDEVQHQVTFTQGFWMQETEVTQAMWNSVMDANPSRFQGDDNPVENVSWNDFQTFVEKLNALKVAPEGYEFALPTEAQWEYACRAGTTDALYGALDEIAWHENNSGDKTHPVATKAANAWGIFDMIGNVSEWVADAKGAYPTEAVTDPVNPGAERSDRVTRGGSYDDDAEDCRAAARSDEEPGDRDEEVGGRLALVRVN